jgi:hypothetical protein
MMQIASTAIAALVDAGGHVCPARPKRRGTSNLLDLVVRVVGYFAPSVVRAPRSIAEIGKIGTTQTVGSDRQVANISDGARIRKRSVPFPITRSYEDAVTIGSSRPAVGVLRKVRSA